MVTSYTTEPRLICICHVEIGDSYCDSVVLVSLRRGKEQEEEEEEQEEEEEEEEGAPLVDSCVRRQS